ISAFIVTASIFQICILFCIEVGYLLKNGQWAMGNGQWAIGNGQWAMGNRQWAMGNGQWAMGTLELNKFGDERVRFLIRFFPCPMPHAPCPMPNAQCPSPQSFITLY
ncbi:hypothetical protein OGM63_01555, partial [Plectonema radiosum NIES-515]